MAHIYNAPSEGAESTIGPQQYTHYWDRRSLIDAAEEMFFSPLADVKMMPKHYGKELRVFYYVPVLDELNVNDQGIDAAGAVLKNTEYRVFFPSRELIVANGQKNNLVTALEKDVGSLDATAEANDSGGTGNAKVTIDADYADYSKENADAVSAFDIGVTVSQNGGALYGGSRDIGTINAKMPALAEQGGRVNRIGFTRLERKGQLEKYGVFTEWTMDSEMFDTDSELYGHKSRELMRAANEIYEDLLQIDLLNAADTKVYPGSATSMATMSGHNTKESDDAVIDLASLKKLSITLDDNRTPKKTTIIKGSRMIDTRTISASRICFIGSELQIHLSEMKDTFNNPAFVPVEQYADAATIMNGEIGAIPSAYLRIVVVPQMMFWSGKGATATSSNRGYQTTSFGTVKKYDVAPMLVVGQESFATIGLQGMGTQGKQKFRMILKKPGIETAHYRDPYGETGFVSLKFFYGFIKLRGERIAVAHSLIPT